MPLWLRLLITLLTMLATSLVAGLLWRWLFNADIPNYLSGVVGGITAIPIWELLKRIVIHWRGEKYESGRSERD
jgi:ABC-type sugar transport system permease subunit